MSPRRKKEPHPAIVRLRQAEEKVRSWEYRLKYAAENLEVWRRRVEQYRNRARTLAPDELDNEV